MKKLLSILLVCGLLLSLAACGGGDSGDPSNENVKQESPVSNSSGKSDASQPDQSIPQISGEPISLADAKQPSDNDFIYNKYNNYVELMGYKGPDEVILVPSTIEGLPVECQGFSIAEGSSVRGIVFAEGYTNIPRIGYQSENGAVIEAVGIPATCEDLPNNPENPFSNLPYLKTIEVAEGNPVYSVEDGILYAMRSESKLLMCYPAVREGDSFVQPEGTFLASYAFANNACLKRVENANTWIDGGAFNGSAVEEVVCSEDWTYLGQNAFSDFSGASELKSITLSVNLDSHVGNAKIFAGLDKLEEILVPEGNSEYFSEDGVLYYVDKNGVTYLMLYPNARPGEEFTPSERADGIYYVDRAFDNPLYLKKIHAGNMNLQGVEFPNGIEAVTP